MSAGRTRFRAPEPVLLSVYDGRTWIGLVLARGKAGYEAFGADDRSVGVYPTGATSAASDNNNSRKRKAPARTGASTKVSCHVVDKRTHLRAQQDFRRRAGVPRRAACWQHRRWTP